MMNCVMGGGSMVLLLRRRLPFCQVLAFFSVHVIMYLRCRARTASLAVLGESTPLPFAFFTGAKWAERSASIRTRLFARGRGSNMKDSSLMPCMGACTLRKAHHNVLLCVVCVGDGGGGGERGGGGSVDSIVRNVV